jgi:hypothetical protein
MQRRIFSLLFLIAGVLLLQSVQAQEMGLLVDAGAGQNLPVPPPYIPPPYDFSGNTIFVVYAHPGGTITQTGSLTLNVQGDNFRALYALGTGRISMDLLNGQTVINMTSMDVISRVFRQTRAGR